MGWFGRQAPRINDELWARLLADYAFIGQRPEGELARLRLMSGRFLAQKQFAGAHGLMIDDYMGAAVAIQACLPVLAIGLDWYDDFGQIIIYPDQFRYRGQETDDIGLIHEHDDLLAGQSIDSGPIVLSWADASPASAQTAYNVVIHEFVHKIDLRDGSADGVPPLPRHRREQWQRTLAESFEEFVAACDAADRALPSHIDPDSNAAWPYYQHLPLDLYAAEHPAEFFAVCAEALFTNPSGIRDSFGPLHALLTEFFGLHPETLTFLKFAD